MILESSLFATFGGLPLHPLLVHFAVVLLPVAALGLVAEVLVPALRRRYVGLTVLGLAGGTVAAFLAKESGEALARTEGLPAQHASIGTLLPWAAVALLAVATLWWLALRRSRDAVGAVPSAGTKVAGAVVAVFAVAVAALTVAVGHTGATAVWNPEPAGAAAPAAPVASAPPGSPAPSASGTAAPAANASAGPSPTASTTALSADAVARHATASSCWTIVNGTVYDLTPWVTRHPGGQQRILGMCGHDATAAFTAQHGSSKRVAQVLSGFEVGPLTH